MKVILDFPNLRDSPNTAKHIETMMRMAKDAKGFLFFIDRGKTSALQKYQLSDPVLATLIMELEMANPGIKIIKMMAGGG